MTAFAPSGTSQATTLTSNIAMQGDDDRFVRRVPGLVGLDVDILDDLRNGRLRRQLATTTIPRGDRTRRWG
jgi:hypothetical protein